MPNKLQYLERKPHYAGPLSWPNWNLECWFLEGGKPDNPEKNPQSKAKTNNKLKTHMAPSRNIVEPRPHWWEASAPTSVPSCCPSQEGTKTGLEIVREIEPTANFYRARFNLQ